MVRMRTNYTLAGATVVALGPAPRGYTYLLQLFVDDAQQVVEPCYRVEGADLIAGNFIF